MTREQAIAKVEGIGSPGRDESIRQVLLLEALGLLKLEEAEPKTHDVPMLGYSKRGRSGGEGPLHATIREDTMIETLRMAGYEVKLKPYEAHA